MMLRFVLACLAFVVSLGANGAFAVTLRSGEHNTFVRFVLQIPEASKWRIENGSTEFEVTFSEPKPSIDTSRAFERITRDVISDIEAIENGLVFRKQCDCMVSALQNGANLLIIDVYDDGDAYATERSALRDASVFQPMEIATDVGVEDVQQDVQIKITRNRNAFDTDTFALELPRANHFSSALVSNLENARTQVPIFTEPLDDQVEQEFDIFSNLRSLDENSQIAAELACKTPKIFGDLSDIVEDGFTTRHARYREELFNDLNRLNKEALDHLAELYVYFGFGAEAMSTLDMRGAPSDANALLTTLATILEYGDDALIEREEQYSACIGSRSFWDFIAVPDLPVLSDEAGTDILRQFARLPEQQKSIFAPIAVKRFREGGNIRAAQYVLRSMELHQGSLSEALKLEQARLGETGTTPVGSESILFSLANTSTLEAPVALAELIDARVENREELSRDTVVLAEAYALQYRESSVGPRLERARIMALAKSGQFLQAVKQTQEAGMAQDSADILMNDVLEAAIEEADDLTFLTVARTPRLLGSYDVSVENLKDMAERLQTLGFWETSEEILQQIPSDQRDVETVIMFAALQTAADQHDLALETLGTIDTDKAKSIRAQALFGLGRYQDALDVAPADAPATIVEDATFFAALADGAENEDPVSDLETGQPRSLADYETLVDASSELRQEVGRGVPRAAN